MVEAATAGEAVPSGKTLTREGEGDVVDGDAAHPQQHQAQYSPQPCQQQPSNLIITNKKQCKPIKAPVMGLVAYENKPFIVKPQPIIPPTENHTNSITGNNITTASNTKGKVNKPDNQGEQVDNTSITGKTGKIIQKGNIKQPLNPSNTNQKTLDPNRATPLEVHKINTNNKMITKLLKHALSNAFHHGIHLRPCRLIKCC